jgi:hypothetical protein
VNLLIEEKKYLIEDSSESNRWSESW